MSDDFIHFVQKFSLFTEEAKVQIVSMTQKWNEEKKTEFMSRIRSVSEKNQQLKEDFGTFLLVFNFSLAELAVNVKKRKMENADRDQAEEVLNKLT
ncbi:hypothetical protein HYV57_00050 [Candidatus Peregrinibacteria bacterium]|nr:hypothetical protein [Candidatus Peregrinibacteria bacterium]